MSFTNGTVICLTGSKSVGFEGIRATVTSMDNSNFSATGIDVISAPGGVSADVTAKIMAAKTIGALQAVNKRASTISKASAWTVDGAAPAKRGTKAASAANTAVFAANSPFVPFGAAPAAAGPAASPTYKVDEPWSVFAVPPEVQRCPDIVYVGRRYDNFFEKPGQVMDRVVFGFSDPTDEEFVVVGPPGLPLRLSTRMMKFSQTELNELNAAGIDATRMSTARPDRAIYEKAIVYSPVMCALHCFLRYGDAMVALSQAGPDGTPMTVPLHAMVLRFLLYHLLPLDSGFLGRLDTMISTVIAALEEYRVLPVGCAILRIMRKSPQCATIPPERLVLHLASEIVTLSKKRDLPNIHAIMCLAQISMTPSGVCAARTPMSVIQDIRMFGSPIIGYFVDPFYPGTMTWMGGVELKQYVDGINNLGTIAREEIAGRPYSEEMAHRARHRMLATFERTPPPGAAPCPPDQRFETSMELTHGFLASMVGARPIRLSDGQECTFTLCPSDVFGPAVIIRSADTAGDDLLACQKNEGRRLARAQYSKLPFSNLFDSMPQDLKTASLSITEDDQVIVTGCSVRMDDGRIMYDQRLQMFSLPMIDEILDNTSMPLDAKAYAIMRLAYLHVITMPPQQVMVYTRFREVMQLLLRSAAVSKAMPRIHGRLKNYREVHAFGSNWISSADVIVVQLLLLLGLIAPGTVYSTLSVDSLEFKLGNAFFYWTEVLAPILECELPVAVGDIMPFSRMDFANVPTMRPYQVMCLDQLTVSDNQLDVLWLEVGAGKTRIILEYIKRLGESRTADGASEGYSTVIWIGPTSSFANIERQIQVFGFQVRTIKSNSDYPRAGYINLVSDTHIDAINPEVHGLMLATSLLVLDELHIYYTPKKSSDVVGLITACRHVIAMTGTIYKNLSSPDEIAKILSYSAEYPVTRYNFRVALGSVVTGPVEKPSKAHTRDHRIEVSSSISDEENHRILLDSLVSLTRYIVTTDQLGVFLVIELQKELDLMAEKLHAAGLTVEVMKPSAKVAPKSYGPDHMPPTDGRPGSLVGSSLPQVLLTHSGANSGYDANRYVVLVMPVMKVNNITVTQQLRGRIDRVNNTAPAIYYHLVYTSKQADVHCRLTKALAESDVLRDITEFDQTGGVKRTRQEMVEAHVVTYHDVTYANIKTYLKRPFAECVDIANELIRVIAEFAQQNPGWPMAAKALETIAALRQAQIRPKTTRKK